MSADESFDPPWNFSWVVDNELAAMACPNCTSNMRYLENQGIKHLVTLSPENKPAIHSFPEIKWTQIPIREFKAPTVSEMIRFIELCKKCLSAKEPVAVHCRMGRGRTGVMAACYLVYFYGQSPDRAILNIRLMRPGSVETYEQEKAVHKFNDYIHTSSNTCN